MSSSEVKVLRRDPLAQWKRMIENNIECMQSSRGNGYRRGHFRSAEKGDNLRRPLRDVQYPEIDREDMICNISKEIVSCEPVEQGITGHCVLNHHYEKRNTDDEVKKLAMVNQKGTKLENSETTDLCVQSFNLDNSKRAYNEDVIESHSCQEINYVCHKGETDLEEIMNLDFLNNSEAVYSTDIINDVYPQLFTDVFVSDTNFYFNNLGNIESNEANTYTQNIEIHNAGTSSHECTAVSTVARTSVVDEQKWTDEIYEHEDSVTGEPGNAGSTGTVCKIHNCSQTAGDFVDNGQSTFNTNTDCDCFQSVDNGQSTLITDKDCNCVQSVDNGQSTFNTNTDCDCFQSVDNGQSTFNTNTDWNCFQSVDNGQSTLITDKDCNCVQSVDNGQSTLITDKDCNCVQSVDNGQSTLTTDCNCVQSVDNGQSTLTTDCNCVQSVDNGQSTLTTDTDCNCVQSVDNGQSILNTDTDCNCFQSVDNGQSTLITDKDCNCVQSVDNGQSTLTTDCNCVQSVDNGQSTLTTDCNCVQSVDNGQSTLTTDTDCNCFQSVDNGQSTLSTNTDCQIHNCFRSVDNGQSTYSAGTDCKAHNDCFQIAGVDNNQSTLNTDKDCNTHNKCFQSLDNGQGALNTDEDCKTNNNCVQSTRNIDNHQSTLKTDKDCKTHSCFQNVDIGQSRLNKREVGTQDMSNSERQDVRMCLTTVDQERLRADVDSAVSFVNAYDHEYVKTDLEHTLSSGKGIQANEGNIIKISQTCASDDEFDVCSKDIDGSIANNTSDTSRPKNHVLISSKKVMKKPSENDSLQHTDRHTLDRHTPDRHTPDRHTPDCRLPACDITTSTVFYEKKHPVRDGRRTPYILPVEEPFTSIVNKAQKQRCIPVSGSITPVYANTTLTKSTHKTEAYNSVIDCCIHTEMPDKRKEYYSVVSLQCGVSLSITDSVNTSRNVNALRLPSLEHFVSKQLAHSVTRQLSHSMCRHTELYKSASADNLAIEHLYESGTICINSVKQDTTSKVLYADSKCSQNKRSMTSRRDVSISDCRQGCCECDDQKTRFEHDTAKPSESYPSKRKESKATYCSSHVEGSKHLTRNPMTQWTRLINANIEAMLENKRVDASYSQFGGLECHACEFGMSGCLYTRSLDIKNTQSGSYDSSNLLWHDDCKLRKDNCNLQKVHSEKNHEVNKYQKASKISNAIINLNSLAKNHGCCNKTDVSIVNKHDDGEIDPASNNLSMNILEENKLESSETDNWHWYSAKSDSIRCSYSQDHIGSYCHEKKMNATYDQKEGEILDEKCMNVCENNKTAAIQDINVDISCMLSKPQINNTEPSGVCSINSVVHKGESAEVYKHDIHGQHDPSFVRNHTAYTENEISNSAFEYANENYIKECNVSGFRHRNMPWRQCRNKDLCSLAINYCDSHDGKEVSTDEVRAHHDMTNSEIINGSERLNTTVSGLDDSTKGADSFKNTSYDKHNCMIMYTLDSSEMAQASKCETNTLQEVTVSEFNCCDGDIDVNIAAYSLDTLGANEHLHSPRRNQSMRQCANVHLQDTTTNTSYNIDSKICYCGISTSVTLDRKLNKMATNSSTPVASGIIETSTNITSDEQNDVSCTQHSDSVASLHDDATLNGREAEAEEYQSDIDLGCGSSLSKNIVSISRSTFNLSVPVFQHSALRKKGLRQSTSVENFANKDACRSYTFCLKSVKPNTLDRISYTDIRGANNGKFDVEIKGVNSGRADTEIKGASSEKFDTKISCTNNDTEINGANNDTEIRSVSSVTEIRGANIVTEIRGVDNDTGIRGTNIVTEIRGADSYTGIRGANIVTEIRGVDNDTGIRGANIVTEIRGVDNDTGIRGANIVTEIRGVDNDTGIRGAHNDSRIRSANNDNDIKGAYGEKFDTEISCANNDTKIRSANNDTEIRGVDNDTEISCANNDTKIRSANNDTEIRSANNDTEIRSAINDTEISCANNDTKIRSASNDTEIRSANNDTEIRSANNDTEISCANNDTKIRSANTDTEIRSANNDTEIRSANNDTEIRSANSVTEIIGANSVTEIRGTNNHTKIRSANNDTEIRSANNDTEIRSANNDTEIRSANSDTEIKLANNDTEIRSANNDTEIRGVDNDTGIRGANIVTEIRGANNDTGIRSANNDTGIRGTNNDTDIKGANGEKFDTEIRGANSDTEIRSVNNDTEIRSANNDTKIRSANNDTEIRDANSDTEIRGGNNDTEIRSANIDTEIRGGNNDTEIRSANIDTEIRGGNNDAEIRSANIDTEIRGANSDIEIRVANNYTEIRSANNDTEIRSANNDTEIRSANNDTEIRSANIDTEIRGANSDTEIRGANNDTEIKSANIDTEIRSVNNDTEIRSANIDTEIRSANNDTEIRSANIDTEIRNANNEPEIRSANSDTEIKSANNDTEIRSANGDTEIRSANSDTEIRSANSDTEIRSANSDTEIRSANSDTEIRSANIDTEIRNANFDTEIRGANSDTEIRGANNYTGIRSANNDTGIRSANNDTGIRSANNDTEIRSANNDIEIRDANSDTEIKGANNDTGIRSSNNDTGIRSANNDVEIRDANSDTEIKGANSDTGIRSATNGICLLPLADCSGHICKKAYNVKDKYDLLQSIAAAKFTESHNSVRKDDNPFDIKDSNKTVKHLTRNPLTQWTRLVNANIEAVLRKKAETIDQQKYGDRDFEPCEFVTSGFLQTAHVNTEKIQSGSSNVNTLQFSHNDYHLDTVHKKEDNELRNNKNVHGIPETVVNLHFHKCNTVCCNIVSNNVNETISDDNIDATSKNMTMKCLEKMKPEKVEFAEKDEWHWYSINMGSIGCVCNQDSLVAYHHDTETNTYGQKEVKVIVDEQCDHVNEVMVVNRPPILSTLQFENISNDTDCTKPVCETACVETNTTTGKEENDVIFMKECKEYTKESRMYNEQENKCDYINDNGKHEQNTDEVYAQDLTNRRIPDVSESLKINEQLILCGHRKCTDCLGHVCKDKYIDTQLKYLSTPNERIHAKKLDTVQSLKTDVCNREFYSCSNDFDFDSNDVSDVNETKKHLHIHLENEFSTQCDRNHATLKSETQVFSSDIITSEVSYEENKTVEERSKTVVPSTIDTVLRFSSEFDEMHKMNYSQQSCSFDSLMDDMSTLNTCTDETKYGTGVLSKRNSVRNSKSAHALIISTFSHSVFKQNRLYQSTSAENIVTVDRYETRTCHHKVRKPNRLSRISNSAVRGAITGNSIGKLRNELSGDGCRCGCFEDDKTLTMQCFQQATLNISQLHPSDSEDSKRKYCILNTKKSIVTMKHLTRNPVTQWTRLVNDNIEAVFKTKVGEIDHAKYGGGDFEPCTSSKSYVIPDISLEKTSGESETAKTDTEKLCSSSDDILSVKQVNGMPGISSICTDVMETPLREQVKSLTPDLCQSGENKAVGYMCSVADATLEDSLLDYHTFDDVGNTMFGLQLQQKEHLCVGNSCADVSTVVECSLDEQVYQNTSETNASSQDHVCDCGAADWAMGHHDDAISCVPSGGCNDLNANTLNGLSVDELDNEPSSDLCCTESGECKLQNMEQLNVDHDEHSMVSKTVSPQNRITGGNLSESEIRVTALNNRQGMFNSVQASDVKEAVSCSADCLQCLKCENDDQETHTFQFPIPLERADAKLQCKSVSQQQIQQVMNQWNAMSLASPFWHSKRPLKNLDVTIYVHKSKGCDSIFSKNKSIDCDDKVCITGTNRDENIISITGKRKYLENTSRTDKGKDMDMIFCTDEKKYQETISSTYNSKDQDKICSMRKRKDKKNKISRSHNSKYKDIICRKDKSDEHSNISLTGVGIQMSEDNDRVCSNSCTEAEVGNVAKQDRAVEVLDELPCEDRSYTTGWSRFWHFMTHIFTDLSTPQPHENDAANQELTKQNKQSSQDAKTSGHKHKVPCSNGDQGQECNELGSIFLCHMNSLHDNEKQTLNSVCNKYYSDSKSHRKRNIIPGIKMISCEENSAATEYGETVKSSNKKNSNVGTDWREPKENILFGDQVMDTFVGTGYLSSHTSTETFSYFLVPQNHNNNDANFKQTHDKSENESALAGNQETFIDNKEFSGLCEYRKRHNKTRIPVFISRHSKNVKQDVSNLNMTGRCHENEENSLKSRRKHKHESGSEVRNHNMLETGSFVTVTGNSESVQEHLCDFQIIQDKTPKMFLVDSADKTTIYDEMSQCEGDSINDTLHKIGAAETHSRKYSTTAVRKSTSIKDDTDNIVHLLYKPARIRGKITVNTKSTPNDANLRDYFQELVAVDHRAQDIHQHAQGSCKDEYSYCDQSGSELLQSSLECLLEMLLQRGKVTHAFIANTEGEIMAKTAKCSVAANDIKNILFSLTSSYIGMVKIAVVNDVYTCFKHDQDSLIGRATTNIFVARRGRQSVVVGFSDAATTGSCIKEVHEISELLSHRGL